MFFTPSDPDKRTNTPPTGYPCQGALFCQLSTGTGQLTFICPGKTRKQEFGQQHPKDGVTQEFKNVRAGSYLCTEGQGLVAG